MDGKLKILIAGKNILEISETEPGKIAFVMYPDDLQDDTNWPPL